MSMTLTRQVPSGLSASGVTLEAAARSYLLNCRSRGLTRDTQAIYDWELKRFGAYLARQGMPVDIGLIRPEHIEMYLSQMSETLKPATVSLTFRSLRTFFGWAVDKDEIAANPMAKMHGPIVPLDPPPVLRQPEMDRLLEVVKGRGFEERRDRAIFLLMYDTGIRRGELVNMDATDVDLRLCVASVKGKGRVFRPIAIGDDVAEAMDRYLRVRGSHHHASDPALWLGTRGRLSGSGVLQMFERRGLEAGVSVHPHQLRHSFAHAMLAAGAGEVDVMALGGWRSRDMLQRYGAIAKSERAVAAHRKLSPADALRRGAGR